MIFAYGPKVNTMSLPNINSLVMDLVNEKTHEGSMPSVGKDG
jgi:hypothetical protein